jgi:hypothetical protein
MLTYPPSQSARLPVVMKTTAGSPVAGLGYGSISVTIIKSNGSQSNVSVGAGDWVEASGAYLSQGYYNLLITGSQMDVTGVFQYCASAAGAVPYFGVVQIASASTGDFNATDRSWLSATYVSSTLYLSSTFVSSSMAASTSAFAYTTAQTAVTAANSAAFSASLSYGSAQASYTASAAAYTASVNASSSAVSASVTSSLAYSVLGTPMSGTIAADISATYHAALTVTASFSGAISASVDLAPVLEVLGSPVVNISNDVREVARLAKATAALVKSKK